MEICYRWLGVAGLEFTADGYSLLIDPFFTRPGKLALLSGKRVRPDAKLIAQHITSADAILVTHAHYDHLLDVPEVMHQTGARAYGTANTCDVLALHNISVEKVERIGSGDHLSLGPFEVDVFPAIHTRIPFQRLLNGPLEKRLLVRPHLPLRLMDYRMDTCLSFHIRTGDRAFLVGNHPVPADVLFIAPYNKGRPVDEAVKVINPRQVVLIHWDDFTRSISSPLLSMPVTPIQGPRAGRRMLGRIDMEAVVKQMERKLPGARVIIPQLLQKQCF
jgi:L-ascorbate metabolism protein UlaG (beta-lactamase superfamily)